MDTLFFLQGGEMDDVFQEGMIGLYKAIRDFSAGTSSFGLLQNYVLQEM